MIWMILFVFLALLLPLLRLRFGVRDAVLEHLAGAVRQGLPLGAALNALAQEQQEAGARRQAATLRDLAERVESTGSLGAALERFPRQFPRRLRAEVAAAERAGTLPEVLELARLEQEQVALSGLALAEHLAYPCLLIVLVGGVGTFLGEVVQPKLYAVLDSLRVGSLAEGLPQLANALLLGGTSLLLGAGIVLGGAGALGHHARRLVRALCGRLPLLGAPLRRGWHAAWMARAGAAVRSGATLGEALDASAEAAPAGVRALRAARDLAATGAPLELVLERALGRDAPALLPELLVQTRGEGLAAGLARTAERVRDRSRRRLEALGKALSPLPVLACGLVVGVHVWSTWTLIGQVQREALRGWDRSIDSTEEVR